MTRLTALVAVIGAVSLVGVSCAEEPPPVETVGFNSPATGTVHIDVFFSGAEADPPTDDVIIPVDVDLAGTASGTWVKGGPGAFNVTLDIDGGSFELDTQDPNVGVIEILYSVNAPAVGTGAFDPSTGVGGFSATLTLTIDEIVGLGPIPPACDTGLDMALSGQIDPATGELSVSQDSFSVISPGETDCGGLGALFGQLLGGPDNSASFSFSVEPQAAA